jgi:hypothetical protein
MVELFIQNPFRNRPHLPTPIHKRQKQMELIIGCSALFGIGVPCYFQRIPADFNGEWFKRKISLIFVLRINLSVTRDFEST